MEAKSQNKLQVNVQTSYREKCRSNEKDFLMRQVWHEVHKKGKGKEQAVMSDGAGRWLGDAFPISLVIGVNPQTPNPEKTLE